MCVFRYTYTFLKWSSQHFLPPKPLNEAIHHLNLYIINLFYILSCDLLSERAEGLLWRILKEKKQTLERDFILSYAVFVNFAPLPHSGCVAPGQVPS